MTAPVFKKPLRPVTGQIENDILASRKMLLSLPGFLHFFQNVSHASAIFSTSRKLVMANRHLTDLLGLNADDELVGAALGEFSPGPTTPSSKASTQFLEIQGKGFLVLTLGGFNQQPVTSHFVGP